MPHKLLIVEEPFQQWDLEFIGVINTNSSVGHNFIVIATNYFIRWSEAMPCKNAD